MFHLIGASRTSDKLDEPTDPLQAQEKCPSTFPKPLLFPRTLNCSRGRTFASRTLMHQTVPRSTLFHNLSLRARQLQQPPSLILAFSYTASSPTIITSCAIMDRGGFLAGVLNNQALTIATVITILHVKFTIVMQISSSFHRPQANNSIQINLPLE